MNRDIPTNFILLISILLIGVLIAATIWLRYTGYLSEGLATLIIGGISAFATTTLAIATYTTILQNRRTVKELQKDREKPIVENILRQLVVPFIEKLDFKIESMERKTTFWMHIGNAYGEYVGIVPHERLLSNNISDTVLRELERYNSRLFEQIENHDKTARNLEKAINEVLEILEARIQEFADEHSLENDEGEPIDAERISRYVQAEYTQSGFTSDTLPRNHEELWESHGDALRNLKDEKIVNKVNEAETEYLECCKSLKTELVNYKLDLQQQYGISEQDARL